MITNFKLYENDENDESKNLSFGSFFYLKDFKEHILHMIEKFGIEIFEYEKDKYFKYRLKFSYSDAEWIMKDIGKDLFSRFIKSASDEGISLNMSIYRGRIYLKEPKEVKRRYGRIETRFSSEREYDYAYFYPSPHQYSNIKDVKKLINDMIENIETIKKIDEYDV